MSDELKKAIEIIKGFTVSKPAGVVEFKETPTPEQLETFKEEWASKAMTSANMPYLKPRYEPNPGVTNRQFTNLQNDPFNGKILNGEFINDSDYQAPDRNEATRKSCENHGTSYDLKKGCYHCNINKSSMCKGCGETLMKAPGGSSKCYTCEG